MKAIILSAGQGKRLRPLTEDTPKCLLSVRGDEPVLEVQLRALAECGVEEAVVFVGFRADKVENLVARRSPDGIRVETVFNPFYAVSDNLATCWLARAHMQDEFLILNGDTLFEPAVLRRLLASPEAPLTLAINEKTAYDDDDMKVSLSDAGRLVAVGKDLDSRIVDGESIGLMLFRGEGGERFRKVIEAAIRQEDAIKRWYLQVVNEMAQESPVSTVAITGLWWGELDSPEDLAELRVALGDDDKSEARVHRAQFSLA
jgi:choline kinase